MPVSWVLQGRGRLCIPERQGSRSSRESSVSPHRTGLGFPTVSGWRCGRATILNRGLAGWLRCNGSQRLSHYAVAYADRSTSDCASRVESVG